MISVINLFGLEIEFIINFLLEFILCNMYINLDNGGLGILINVKLYVINILIFMFM